VTTPQGCVSVILDSQVRLVISLVTEDTGFNIPQKAKVDIGF